MPDGQGSCSNGGIERGESMSDMRELIPQLDVIPVERTSLIPAPAEKPKRDPAPIRRKRDKTVRWLIRVLAASLTMNMLQWVIIYILQAGPI